MSRTLDRSIARVLYSKFSKNWRREVRAAGLYGKPNAPKRPRFSQWYAMHEQDRGMMAESTPQDVAEYLGDPWAVGEAARFERSVSSDEGERGVVTIPIAGDDEE